MNVQLFFSVAVFFAVGYLLSEIAEAKPRSNVIIIGGGGGGGRGGGGGGGGGGYGGGHGGGHHYIPIPIPMYHGGGEHKSYHSTKVIPIHIGGHGGGGGHYGGGGHGGGHYEHDEPMYGSHPMMMSYGGGMHGYGMHSAMPYGGHYGGHYGK